MLIAIIVIAIALGAAAAVQHARDMEHKAIARGVAATLHLKSGEYPAVCSWCRTTSLARKVFVYHRQGDWVPVDMRAYLATMSAEQVPHASRTAYADALPDWRRFCSEKCTREFLHSERAVVGIDAFVPCAYCSTRNPASLQSCTNCGAPRR